MPEIKLGAMSEENGHPRFEATLSGETLAIDFESRLLARLGEASQYSSTGRLLEQMRVPIWRAAQRLARNGRFVEDEDGLTLRLTAEDLAQP